MCGDRESLPLPDGGRGRLEPPCGAVPGFRGWVCLWAAAACGSETVLLWKGPSAAGGGVGSGAGQVGSSACWAAAGWFSKKRSPGVSVTLY